MLCSFGERYLSGKGEVGDGVYTALGCRLKMKVQGGGGKMVTGRGRCVCRVGVGPAAGSVADVVLLGEKGMGGAGAVSIST